MASDSNFDPYYQWLGIPPTERPINHYRLLGVELFEDNGDVIAHAADRQMSHLKSFATGPHASDSQQLLNALAKARLCLLNAEAKTVYDQQLRAMLAPAPQEPLTPSVFSAPSVTPTPHTPLTEVDISPQSTPQRKGRRKVRTLTEIFSLLVLIAMLGAVACVLVIKFTGEPPVPKPGPPNAPPTLDSIANISVVKKPAEQTVDLNGIGAGGNESQPLKVTATTSDPKIVLKPEVIYTSPKDKGSLKLKPNTNQRGTATIAVTVVDGGLDNSLDTAGDNARFSRTFDVTVSKPTPEQVELGSPIVNSVDMVLVPIPAGEFMMGSPETETGREDDETQHRVTITNPFYLSVYEVTQAQYQQVMNNNPSHHKGENRPVEQVSCNDAVEFCRKLSDREGVEYRLPTEAEWEYACRAGTTTAYSFGGDTSQLREYAWFFDNSDNTTHPVGEKLPNPWGLFDTHGNVQEWCQDAQGNSHVLRGGALTNPPRLVRAAFGYNYPPDRRGHLIGFRLARTYRLSPVAAGPMVDKPVTPPAAPPESPPARPELVTAIKKFMTRGQVALGGPVVNTIDVVLVPIPAGEFTMGSLDSEEGRQSNDTQHWVKITKPFYLSAYEVTQAQYQQVMNNNPSHHKGENRPVEVVSWNDAVDFCRKLSDREGVEYRLPTKAEWAYACRAGTRTAYSFGDEVSQLDQYAWYRANSGNTTHEVGLKLPNSWGLHDMHGNVWEWCQDWHGPENGDASDPTGPASGDKRVLNGGAFSDLSRHVTFKSSAGQPPVFQHKFAGFRVAKTISGGPDKDSSDTISAVDEPEAPLPTPHEGSTPDLNQGLVAYYPFNGNAKDESGNGHDGTVHGATLAEDRLGNVDCAYEFDGVDDYVDLGSAVIGANPLLFTQIAWVKTSDLISDTAGTGIIMTRRQNASSSWPTLGISNGFPELSNDLPNIRENVRGNQQVNNGGWHQIVGICDHQTLSVFVDGVLEITTTVRAVLRGSTDPFYVGRHAAWHSYFNGSIDDIRIYNRALSAAEVKALYDLERASGFVIPDKAAQAVAKTKADNIYTLNEDIVGEVKLDKKRNPYKLVRSIRVKANAKLTIERGTEILAGPGVTIELVGTIETFGTPNRLVTISNAHSLHPWGGLVAGEGFTGAIEGFEIRGADVGISFGQDAVRLGTIKDCIIGYNMTGVRLNRSRERYQISNTIIANNYKHGIFVNLGTYKLDHCTIANNGEIGILMAYYGDGKVVNCVLDNNPIAIQSKIYTTHLEMTGCNVIRNRRNVDVGTAEAFRCRGNHWGTTNIGVIASSISDGYDKPGLGHVDFSEFVKKPFKKAGAQLNTKRR